MHIDHDSLKKQFSGDVISPENPDYESLRNVYTGTGSPALIARAKTTEDVVTAVNFARDNSLTISVRSGGHHGAGFGTNEGGIVIDLSHMNSVGLYDEQKHLVRIGGGAQWGDVAAILHQHGLALSSGDTKSVGVGGLTLGGGIGWMVRKWGLTIDQLIGAEVVTANGEILHVDEAEHSDLFWAIRGGGGNFGVVTHFEFAAHELDEVYAGPIVYEAQNVEDLIKKWRACTEKAPEELTTFLTLMPSFAPEIPKSIMLLICYAGDNHEAAMEAIEPFKHLGNMTSEAVTKKPYTDVLEEAHPPAGMNVFVNNILTPKLSDELVEQVVDIYANNSWVFQIRGIAGALNRVPAGTTAFAHRDSTIMMFAGAFVPQTSGPDALIEAAKPWAAIAPFATGSYANFISSRTGDEVTTIYPDDTYKKLADIKRTYDPQNLFNQNYNIKPAGDN